MLQELIVYIILGATACYAIYRWIVKPRISSKANASSACSDCPVDCALRDLNVSQHALEADCGRENLKKETVNFDTKNR